MAGCSFWPDRWLLGDLKPCCDIHDDLYAIGGIDDDRRKADDVLFECIKSVHSKPMAWTMWFGVRMLGWFFFNHKQVGLDEVDV